MPRKSSVRLVLVSSPLTFRERYGVFAGAGSSQPSFALVCLAAVARLAGAEVTVLDALAEGLDVSRARERITSFAPDIVGISSATAGIVASAGLARVVKDALPRVSVIVGGSHITALPVETMREFSSFDLGVIGEGEDTLTALLNFYHCAGELPSNAKGTVVRVDGEIRVNPQRPPLRDLDSLPLPAWELLRGFPSAYQPSPARVKRMPCASVVLTRGCPNHCDFCDRSVFGNVVRRYSPDYAVSLFRDLRMNYGVREILVEDDTFFTSNQWLAEFCGKLAAAKLDVTWSCLGRADRVSFAMLRQLRNAGCWHVSFGIESGDPDMLRRMNKGETIQQMEHAIRLCHEAEIQTKGFFILGFPGENAATIAKTREFAIRLPLDDISLMFLTPFPGSALYGYARQYGTFDCDWRRMTTLESVFVPHGLSEAELRCARADIIRSFYFRTPVLWSKARHLLARPRLWRHMLGSLKTLLKVSRA